MPGLMVRRLEVPWVDLKTTVPNAPKAKLPMTTQIRGLNRLMGSAAVGDMDMAAAVQTPIAWDDDANHQESVP